jgi:hypothetical protein
LVRLVLRVHLLLAERVETLFLMPQALELLLGVLLLLEVAAVDKAILHRQHLAALVAVVLVMVL